MTKDNSGALFKEEDKKSEKHPDYKGNCLINGQKMYIAAWINTAESGKKYMSLSFSEPSQDANYKKETSSQTSAGVGFSEPSATPVQTNDDLPF